MNKRPVVMAVGLTVAGVAAGFGVRALADGVPSPSPLYYSGTLTENGALVNDSTHTIAINVYASQSANSTICQTIATSVPITNGRFRIQLDSACKSAINANPNAWVEVLDGTLNLGRTAIGAVPYAVEADHAMSATNATSATTAATANTAGGALQTTIAGLAPANTIPQITGWAQFTSDNEPVPYTTSGNITNGTTAGRWRRNGDSVQLRLETSFNGAPDPTGSLFWQLPSGLEGDPTALGYKGNVGSVWVWNGATALATACQALLTSDGKSLYAYCAGTSGQIGTSVVSPLVEVDFDVWYPVKGWTVTH
jgi:hypothetical protein